MGLMLDMGAFGAGRASVNGLPAAQTPAAAGVSPQGPTTVGQKAFGIVTGSEGSDLGVPYWALCTAGILSIAGLWWIWYSLPR